MSRENVDVVLEPTEMPDAASDVGYEGLAQAYSHFAASGSSHDRLMSRLNGARQPTAH
jgi:hypothetical protein